MISANDGRQQILDALADGGKTISQITSAVGFPARNLVHIMTQEGVLQIADEKVTNPDTGRKVSVFNLQNTCYELERILFNMVRVRS